MLSCWLVNNIFKRVNDQNIFQVVDVLVNKIFVSPTIITLSVVSKALFTFLLKEPKKFAFNV